MEVELHRHHRNIYHTLTCTVHVLGALHFIYACYYDWNYAVVPKEVLPRYGDYGYKLKFITFWNAVTQASYFSLCLIIDVWGSKNDKNERNCLVKIKDYVEASIAFPIAMFVGITFWGLMAVDRELVLPAALDPYFPSWLNHMMHTNILIFQFLEILTSSRVYPQRKHALIGLVTFQTTYLAWMHVVHYKSGVWAYPIFEKLNIPLRIGFFVGCFTLGGLMYFLGEKLHYLLWLFNANFPLKKSLEDDIENVTEKDANLGIEHPNVKYDSNAVSQ